MVRVVQKGRTPITFEVNEPRLTHEMGQWCAFPDFKEISQYTGAYKARNFEIFSDLLRDNGMASQAEKFLHASGKLQTLAYKYDLEPNRHQRMHHNIHVAYRLFSSILPQSCQPISPSFPQVHCPQQACDSRDARHATGAGLRV